jgi:hypothetical protein
MVNLIIKKYAKKVLKLLIKDFRPGYTLPYAAP